MILSEFIAYLQTLPQDLKAQALEVHSLRDGEANVGFRDLVVETRINSILGFLEIGRHEY